MPRPLKESYGDEKPPFSYISLTAMAVWSSPQKMLPLNEIYKYIMDNYPYYRKNTNKWQNSLRHNLSFNDCFIKIPRTTDKSGKGSYWALHPKALHMFENGSLLRRRRRFRVEQTEKDMLNEELAALASFKRYFLAQQQEQLRHQQQHPSIHHPSSWEYGSINTFVNPQMSALMPSSPSSSSDYMSSEASVSSLSPTLAPATATATTTTTTRPKRSFTIESLIGPDEPSSSSSLSSSPVSSPAPPSVSASSMEEEARHEPTDLRVSQATANVPHPVSGVLPSSLPSMEYSTGTVGHTANFMMYAAAAASHHPMMPMQYAFLQHQQHQQQQQHYQQHLQIHHHHQQQQHHHHHHHQIAILQHQHHHFLQQRQTTAAFAPY